MVESWLVETMPHEKFNFYTRANVGEVFPDPVSPLSFSWFEVDGGIGPVEWGFRQAHLQMGAVSEEELPPDRAFFMAVRGGYGYLNASALRLLGHRAPGMTAEDIDNALFGEAPGVPKFASDPGDDRPDLTAKIGATFSWALTAPNLSNVAEHERWINQLRAERPNYATMSDRELVDTALGLLDDRFAELFAQHILVTSLSTLPVGIITKMTAAIGNPTAALKLIAGVGDVESAAPAMEMWKLSRLVEASTSLTASFEAGIEDLDARLRASDDPQVSAFVEAFDDFLFVYGARGPNEWEPRSPTWETDPDLALAAVDRMRLMEIGAAPQLNNAVRAKERERLGAKIIEMLAGDPETQGQFQAALKSAAVFMQGRERAKTNCIKLIHEARVALREWGRRCVEAGTFPEITSFGLLAPKEMYDFLESPEGYYDTLADREALMAEIATLQEPFLFVGDPGPMSEYPRRDDVEASRAKAGDVVQGIPGCPGIARGTARVITDPHDPRALNPGDILVAPITDPSWTPLFVPAGGVVVDVGAPLSHATIVSRELGIPCVVSAIDATRRIPDGATIGVNGDTGIVTILEINS